MRTTRTFGGLAFAAFASVILPAAAQDTLKIAIGQINNGVSISSLILLVSGPAMLAERTVREARNAEG
jgi:hypothetical protein